MPVSVSSTALPSPTAAQNMAARPALTHDTPAKPPSPLGTACHQWSAACGFPRSTTPCALTTAQPVLDMHDTPVSSLSPVAAGPDHDRPSQRSTLPFPSAARQNVLDGQDT